MLSSITSAMSKLATTTTLVVERNVRQKSMIKEIEQKHDVDVVMAIESGSRAWGIESSDSDYDIRGISIRRARQSYTSVIPTKMPQTINEFSDDRMMDVDVWDISKAMEQLHLMNPTIIEWLMTAHYSHLQFQYKVNHDIVNVMLGLLQRMKNQCSVRMVYHYQGMIKSFVKNYIENKEQVGIKQYMYAARAAVMALYVSRRDLFVSRDAELPLVILDLPWLIAFMSANIGRVRSRFGCVPTGEADELEAYADITRLIEMKRHRTEKEGTTPRIKSIDLLLERSKLELDMYTKEKDSAHHIPAKVWNNAFRQILAIEC